MDAALLGKIVTALIPVIAPILILLVKKGVSALPTWLLPILAPILGVAIDAANGWLTGQTLGGVWGAILGAAGVGVREVLDQIKQAVRGAP